MNSTMKRSTAVSDDRDIMNGATTMSDSVTSTRIDAGDWTAAPMAAGDLWPAFGVAAEDAFDRWVYATSRRRRSSLSDSAAT